MCFVPCRTGPNREMPHKHIHLRACLFETPISGSLTLKSYHSLEVSQLRRLLSWLTWAVRGLLSPSVSQYWLVNLCNRTHLNNSPSQGLEEIQVLWTLFLGPTSSHYVGTLAKKIKVNTCLSVVYIVPNMTDRWHHMAFLSLTVS